MEGLWALLRLEVAAFVSDSASVSVFETAVTDLVVLADFDAAVVTVVGADGSDSNGMKEGTGEEGVDTGGTAGLGESAVEGEASPITIDERCVLPLTAEVDRPDMTGSSPTAPVKHRSHRHRPY